MLYNLFLLIIVFLLNCTNGKQSVQNNIVKIGVQAPITGSQASEGQGILNFVKLIVDDYNEQGGILGKKIQVVSCDDEGKTQKSVVCAKRLVNEKVFAVIGSYSSGVTEASQKFYYDAKILQSSVSSNNGLVKKGYWNFFRSSFPNSLQGEFTGEYLVSVKKYKKIAIVSNYSSYSIGLATETTKKIKNLGGNIVFEGKIKSGLQDFSSITTKIKSLNPDVIYFPGYYTDASYLRMQQIKLGIEADFIGGGAVYNNDFIKLAGNNAQGSYIVQVPNPQTLDYSDSKKYIKMYQDKYKQLPPSVFSLASADGLRTILYAVHKLKSFDPVKVSDYLINELEDFEGITGKISFNKEGERIGLNFLVYTINQNNQFVPFYKVN